MTTVSLLEVRIQELEARVKELETENNELKKRPRVVLLERQGVDHLRVRGVRDNYADRLIQCGESYHLEIVTETNQVWEFKTMICLGTPNCFVKVHEFRTNDGNSGLIPTEIYFR